MKQVNTDNSSKYLDLIEISFKKIASPSFFDNIEIVEKLNIYLDQIETDSSLNLDELAILYNNILTSALLKPHDIKIIEPIINSAKKMAVELSDELLGLSLNFSSHVYFNNNYWENECIKVTSALLDYGHNYWDLDKPNQFLGESYRSALKYIKLHMGVPQSSYIAFDHYFSLIGDKEAIEAAPIGVHSGEMIYSLISVLSNDNNTNSDSDLLNEEDYSNIALIYDTIFEYIE